MDKRNTEAAAEMFGHLAFRTERNGDDELELKLFLEADFQRDRTPLNDDTNIFGCVSTIARELAEELRFGEANAGEMIFRVTWEPRRTRIERRR